MDGRGTVLTILHFFAAGRGVVSMRSDYLPCTTVLNHMRSDAALKVKEQELTKEQDG